jgi:uncharacterized protein YerC
MKKYHELSNQEKEGLLEELCEAISVLSGPKEIMFFLTDLLTKQETIMLAKRIKTAKFLLEGKDYIEIQESLKIGHSTISKISQWLAESGEGFRVISERTKKEKEKSKETGILNLEAAKEEWKNVKRRYPMIFWPQLLVEDIIKTMNQKQKEKVKSALEKLDRKSEIYQNINEMLYQKQRRRSKR